MTHSRLSTPSLPLFLLAAAVVALLAFGLTRWIAAPDAGALPALEVTGDTAAAAPGALDPTKVYAARVDTVVSIESSVGDETINGTGVVVGADGTIVTASHVIKDYGSETQAPRVAQTIVIKFHQGDEVAASLEAIDQFNDLAILKVDPSQVHGLVYAALGDSDQVLTGAEVLALGAPFGFDWTMTTGNVSYAHRLVDSRINRSWKIPDAIQHDAPVNTGNSGGPLFNARGEVIGINQQIASPSKTDSGVSFAVSSNIVKRALNVWRSTGARSIQYADLGLTARTLSPQVAAQAGLKVSSGALIQTAVGPAAAAGLATGPTTTYLNDAIVIGDVITELAGQKITSNEDLLRVAAAISADSPVEVGFTRRDGSKQTATIDPTPRAIV